MWGLKKALIKRKENVAELHKQLQEAELSDAVEMFAIGIIQCLSFGEVSLKSRLGTTVTRAI